MPMPKSPGVTGMGPIPNDEYGDGHRQVDPRFSRNTNRQAVYNHTSDGNIGSYESLYGSPGNEPDPYGGAENGLSPGEQGMDKFANRRFADLHRRGAELLGEDGFTELMEQVLRIAASQEANETQVTGNLDTTGMPRPDFGNQQPYTTGPAGDGDMAALEAHFGYPVSANNLTGNPMAPIRNMPKRNAFAR